MTTKIKRQAKILDLISTHEIETQEELSELLKNEGFSVTQATISRDIREMKLRKAPADGGTSRYVASDSGQEQMAEKYFRVLRDGFVEMDKSGNLIVIHTVSGMAMAVAAALDAMNWPEVAGCIAGDDTIFCAVHSPEEAAQVMGKIRKSLTYYTRDRNELPI